MQKPPKPRPSRQWVSWKLGKNRMKRDSQDTEKKVDCDYNWEGPDTAFQVEARQNPFVSFSDQSWPNIDR